MTRYNVRQHLIGAAVVGSLALTSCGATRGDTTEEELALGEATAALTSSEEEGDVGSESVAFASDADVEATAAETSDGAVPPPESAGDFCDFSAKRQQVLDTYDENKNGKLEAAELKVLKEDLGWVPSRSPRFTRLGWRLRHHGFRVLRWTFDEDGDKQLSAEERAALVDALEARCERIRAEVLEQFDANDDGKLDPAERMAIRQAIRARLQAKYEELLAKYDVDASGRLELAERAQIRADVLAAMRARRAALVEKYDTDGDGKLSTDEALPLRQAIQQRIIEGKQS